MERGVRQCLVVAAMMLAATGARAGDDDDFGVWTEVNAEKKLGSNLTLDGGIELRTRDNAGTLDRWSAGLGASYKLTNWLKVSAGYTFLYDNLYKTNDKGTKYAEYWGPRHRFNVSLTGSHDFGRLNVSLRERWQYTYRPEQTATRYYVNTTNSHAAGDEADTHTYNGKGKNMWRNRLQLKYKVDKMWRPYVSGETYVGGSGMDKLRLSLGTEIRLSKQHSLDVKYMFQKAYDDDDEEGNRHVLGIGYTFKF